MINEELIAEIVTRVIEKLAALENAPCAAAPETGKDAGEIKIEQRVITEKDIIAARGGGASAVCVARRAIMTDLAKEYAQAHGIVIKRC